MNNIENFDMNSTHIATIIEDFSIYSSGNLKCHIPVLMPNIPYEARVKEVESRVTKSNLLNKDASAIQSAGKIVNVNYVNIYVPRWIRSTFESSKGIASKGSKILFVFVEGNLTQRRAIGRYE